jgi:hypothetical protein
VDPTRIWQPDELRKEIFGLHDDAIKFNLPIIRWYDQSAEWGALPRPSLRVVANAGVAGSCLLSIDGEI